VLFFYPKDDTDGCTRENQDFSTRLAEFKKANTLVFGISPDDIQSHAAFTAKHTLTVPLIADPAHEAIGPYGVWGEKKNFGKPYMGLIRTTYLIDSSGHIAAHWKVHRVNGHAEAALTAAQELANTTTRS